MTEVAKVAEGVQMTLAEVRAFAEDTASLPGDLPVTGAAPHARLRVLRVIVPQAPAQ